jgi:hypothetical protein
LIAAAGEQVKARLRLRPNFLIGAIENLDCTSGGIANDNKMLNIQGLVSSDACGFSLAACLPPPECRYHPEMK